MIGRGYSNFYLQEDSLMKRNVLLAAVLTLVLGIVTGAILANTIVARADTTRYVTEGGTGDGTSWANASGALQDMIDAVETAGGGTVCVASGTYTPTELVEPGTPRSIAFQMKNGVGIYGGFPSTGSPTWVDRDWESNLTVLSGEIGNPGTKADNCYHVFYHPDALNLDDTAMLDGFIVTGGYANGISYPHNSGGGMYNYYSSPAITNCTFRGNLAGYGGGMCNRNFSSPAVTDCTFWGNTGGYGGGMYNYYSSPVVTNCIFDSNSAYVGGGMSNYNSSPAVTGCTFSGNSAVWGSGMHNDSSSPAVTGCTFSGNPADNYGGGMYNNSSSPAVTGCTFSGNSAWGGGGMSNHNYSSPAVTNCTFSGNSADYYGGGMYNNNSSPVVTGCTFWGNSIDLAYYGYGGGMYNYSSSPVVTSCTFSGNSATGGGGMSNFDSSSPVVTNCTFSSNLADYYGGGMYNYYSSPAVTDCTFWGNSAYYDGGGMYNLQSSPAVTNCILWGDIGSEIYTNSGTPVVTYSDIQGGYAGTGNISGTPMFVDPACGDFHLLPTSPCINTGTNSAPNLPDTDFEGDSRIIDSVVDMGVDEFEDGAPWSCLAYDANFNGKIEYVEMVDALMDYLTGTISYSQMIDVLMCYLTS